jgi:hypothetical protein
MSTKTGDSSPIEFPTNAALGVSGAIGGNDGHTGSGNAADLNTLAARVRDEISGVSDLADRVQNAVDALVSASGQVTAAVADIGAAANDGVARILSERSIALGRIAAARVDAINAINAARPTSPQHDSDSFEALINSPSGSFSG